MLTSVFYGKKIHVTDLHPSNSFVVSIDHYYRRFLSRAYRVKSCTFPPVLMEHFRLTLETFGVTVIV